MPRGVGLSRDRVLDLAEAIADREGLDGLDLTALAAAAGVRKPSLYKHVDGLPGVRAGLMLRGYRAVAAVLDGVPVGTDPEADAVALAMAWRGFARAHPGLYDALALSHVHGSPEVAAEGARITARVVAWVAGLGLDDDEALHATRGFRALVDGFVGLERRGGFGLKADPAHSLEAAVRAMARGWRRPTRGR